MSQEMTTQGTGFTVLGLYGENVKRLKVVQIVPPRVGTVKIAGRNNAGKSSVLDLILFALGGGRVQPSLPVRQGTTRAKDVVDLQDTTGRPALRVTRVWTSSNSYLTVERFQDGRTAQIKSPQDFLDSLVGAGLGFDPLAFTRLKQAQQVDQLLDVLQLTEDPREIDAQKSEAAAARTEVNRDARALRARLEACPVPSAEIPDAEVSISALLSERTELEIQQQAKYDAEQAANRASQALQDAEAVVRRLAEQVDELTAKLDYARGRLSVATGAAQSAKTQFETAASVAAQMPDPDFADVDGRLQTVESTNRAVRAKLEFQQLIQEFDAKIQAADTLTAHIRQLDERKRALLLGAKFPVPGLGFEIVSGEYSPTLNGVPLAQSSQSEQIRVGIALAMALTPQVRVVLIRDASVLDQGSMAEVERLAARQDFQVWCEVVNPGGDDDAFVIEEGRVVGIPRQPA